jgi:hypothetical protein
MQARASILASNLQAKFVPNDITEVPEHPGVYSMVKSITIAHRLILLICVPLLLVLQPPADALASESEAGTYGASFLRIPVGPRLLSSTEVVAGMRPDASLVFSNPASLAGIQTKQMFITTASWLDAMQLNAASFVLPIPRASMQLAFSSRLLYSGGLKGYDDAMQVVSEENYYDFSFSTALNKHFDGLGLSLGAGITYIREHLIPENGSGYTFSFGASYRHANNTFQFFAKDIGGEITFNGYGYPVDGRYILGYGRSLNLGQGNLNLGAQLTLTNADTKHLQFGGEYELNHHFVVRSAINHNMDAPQSSDSPLCGGMGFRFWNVSIDYAYTPHSYFPATHMFSFTYTFGKLRSPAGTVMDESAGGVFAPIFPSSPAAQVLSTSADTVSTRAGDEPAPSAASARENGQPAAPPSEAAPPRETPDLKKPLKQSEKAKENKKDAFYTLVVGTHGRKESALSEVRALQLLKIPGMVEEYQGNFRVVVGRYSSEKKALSAARSYEGKGYRFKVTRVE